MTQDGSSFTYTFDDEGHLTIASGMTNGPYCYVYDGHGLRVAKKSNSNSTCSTGTVQKLYWRSLSGDALAETDRSGNAINEYVFFAGRRVASRNSSGNVFYWFADQLGSTRTITDANGNLCYDAEFTPYGQEISHSERLQTTACPPSYKFTGYERDPETTVGQNDTGLDYAFARYYSSRLSRFLSVDRLRGSVGNLQSHNAYAYVVNNPLNAVDPSGMQCIGPNQGMGANHSRACPDSDAPDGGLGGGPGCSLDGCGDGLGGPSGLGGPGCYLNGMSVGCNILGSLLSTVPCPPKGCGVVSIGGVLASYSCYETGCTYVPLGGPGSDFSTEDQALVAGAMYAENQSLLNDGNEQCGITYSSGAGFSYTASVEGDYKNCVPSLGAVPAGDAAYGGYHSHGIADPNYFDERFSGQPSDLPGTPGDLDWSNSNRLMLSLATPGGNIIIYNPWLGCQTFFLGGPAGSGTTIPICQ